MRDQASIVRQISLGCLSGNKTFEFDEQHDRTKPIRMWFQESTEGLVLFVVFYTQACRWSRCLGCCLPSACSQFPVMYRDILKQIDFVFNDPEVRGRQQNIRKLIVSNNGSVLDQATFSSTALIYLVLQSNLHFPNLSVFSIETRVEYVEVEELEFLARVLGEGDTPQRRHEKRTVNAGIRKVRGKHGQIPLSLEMLPYAKTCPRHDGRGRRKRCS